MVLESVLAFTVWLLPSASALLLALAVAVLGADVRILMTEKVPLRAALLGPSVALVGLTIAAVPEDTASFTSVALAFVRRRGVVTVRRSLGAKIELERAGRGGYMERRSDRVTELELPPPGAPPSTRLRQTGHVRAVFSHC